jgi:trehalose 6-phosphate synthase/phosphatase
VREHTAGYWAASNFAELQRACRGHSSLRCYGLGFGLNFRIVALAPNFRRLPTDRVLAAYTRATQRLLIFDYDGTLVPASSSFPNRPSTELLTALSVLASEPGNAVYIVSGRRRALLDDWFAGVKNLGASAEHGAYLRSHTGGEWEALAPGVPEASSGTPQGADAAAVDDDAAAPARGWREVVLPILELYTESTDGSFVERKESALAWHYGDADPEFGSTQAKELLDHMESVLANEPVEVVAGPGVVEIKPQGVGKGQAVARVLEVLAGGSSGIDFTLCLGDDRSDEEMYATLEARAHEGPPGGGGVAPDGMFNCTVGQKPSKASYFLNDPAEAVELLQSLAGGPQEGGTPRLSHAAATGGLELGSKHTIPEER